MIIKFQLQVDKNCNAAPTAPQQTQQTGPPGSSVHQNVSASLTSNVVRQAADPQNPHIHYINMQKQNQASINSGGVTNKVNYERCLCKVIFTDFSFPPTRNNI